VLGFLDRHAQIHPQARTDTSIGTHRYIHMPYTLHATLCKRDTCITPHPPPLTLNPSIQAESNRTVWLLATDSEWVREQVVLAGGVMSM